MQKFLNFDELVTPTIILIVYCIVNILIVIGVLTSLFSGFWSFIAGLIGGVIGLILWRVACEVMLLLFRIHAQLGDIARNTAGAAASRP